MLRDRPQILVEGNYPAHSPEWWREYRKRRRVESPEQIQKQDAERQRRRRALQVQRLDEFMFEEVPHSEGARLWDEYQLLCFLSRYPDDIRRYLPTMTPDDIKRIALPALRHRIALAPDALLEGRTTNDILTEVIETVAAPRV